MALKNKRRGREGNSVNVDLSGVETSRRAIPEGTYSLVVNQVEQKTSREGNPMISFEFEVSEGPHKGAKLFENCSLQPQALFKLKSVLMALGMEIPNKAFDLNLKDLIGLECEVEVGHETYEGKKRARILEYINPEESGDSKEEEDEEEEEEESEDLEDTLSEMDKDELKDLALELDIPKKKVLAAKKVKDLVALILDEADEDDIREALVESSSDEEEPEEDEDDEVDYSEMSLSELKAECKDRGLKVKKGMDKDDLIELLEEDDEEG